MTKLTDNEIFNLISMELQRARKFGDQYSSLHEAYAVLAEEVDEVWDEVRKKRMMRDENELIAEFVQVAAVAIKAIQSVERFV